MKPKLLLSISLMFTLGALQAQTFDVVKMDSLFSSIEEHQEGMGSFSLFYDGEEIYSGP